MCLILKFKLIFIVQILIGQLVAQDDSNFTTFFTEKSTDLPSSNFEPEVANIITTASTPNDKLIEHSTTMTSTSSIEPTMIFTSSIESTTVTSTSSVETRTEAHEIALEDFTTSKDILSSTSVFQTTDHSLTTQAKYFDKSEPSDLFKQSSILIETTELFSTPSVSLETLQNLPTELSTSTVSVHDSTTISLTNEEHNSSTPKSSTFPTLTPDPLVEKSERIQIMDTTSNPFSSLSNNLTNFDSTDTISNRVSDQSFQFFYHKLSNH